MAIPKYQEMMKPLLELSQMETSFQEGIRSLEDLFDLTPEERRTQISSGSQTLVGNRAAWALTYLNKAGLIERPRRGFFCITDAGRSVLKGNPEKIDASFLNQFQSFVDFRTRKQSDASSAQSALDETEAQQTPSELIAATHRQLEEQIQDELLERILAQSPQFFEGLVIDLLIKMGYGGEDNLAKAVGQSGDGGIDGIIHQDSLGLDAVYIQAKRYDPAARIGRPELQKFIGSLSGLSASKGVFITTGGFILRPCSKGL